MSNSPGDAKERVLFEGQRIVIVANIVGAALLFVFLQSIWLQAGATALKKGVLWGIVAFAIGATVAMLGYVARHWALQKNKAGAGLIDQIANLWIPVVAVVCFMLGLMAPVIGGFDSVNSSFERPGLLKEVPRRR